jgi:ribosomal protein S18 acetylase RimI-like enzyme
METAFTIRDATRADVGRLVAVHQLAFSGFFLTLLGRRFLAEVYRAFVVEPDGMCWVTEMPDGQDSFRVVGFVAGALNPARFHRRLLYRRGLHFAFAVLPALCKHPVKVLPRLFGGLRYRGEHRHDVDGAALLSSLGVSPSISRQGLGRALVEVFCQDAARHGARAVYLTTAHRDNEAANTFYEHAGFRLLNTMTRIDGRVMNTYFRMTDMNFRQ